MHAVQCLCVAAQLHVYLLRTVHDDDEARTASKKARGADLLRLRNALQYASRGAKEFVTELVPALKSEFPHVDLVVEAKRGHTPFIEGFYRNGRSKPIGVCLYIYSVCVYVYMYVCKTHTHTHTRKQETRAWYACVRACAAGSCAYASACACAFAC